MRTVLRYLPATARILLGLVFLVFGLNYFLQFLPQPPPPPGQAGAFIGALVASGYLLSLVKAVEIVAGLALLAGRFVPLSLVVLAPITVNIVLFHAFLAPEGMAMTIVLLALHLYLAWAYRDSFRGVLQASARPRVAAAEPEVAGHVAQPARAH